MQWGCVMPDGKETKKTQEQFVKKEFLESEKNYRTILEELVKQTTRIIKNSSNLNSEIKKALGIFQTHVAELIKASDQNINFLAGENDYALIIKTIELRSDNFLYAIILQREILNYEAFTKNKNIVKKSKSEKADFASNASIIFQRLAKYPLLMKELEKSTENNVEYKQAYEDAKEFADMMNNGIKVIDSKIIYLHEQSKSKTNSILKTLKNIGTKPSKTVNNLSEVINIANNTINFKQQSFETILRTAKKLNNDELNNKLAEYNNNPQKKDNDIISFIDYCDNFLKQAPNLKDNKYLKSFENAFIIYKYECKYKELVEIANLRKQLNKYTNKTVNEIISNIHDNKIKLKEIINHKLFDKLHNTEQNKVNCLNQ